ncbi:MAG: hypothetical protein S4CHLAM81_08260 [Chlamydiales bacterium]|nr:hypothetical protein [Chlamydiales bacterium]MCH9635608.1 hypothetical protein [Chlamydiales bacterium]MCH9703870.1 hypothetical protein [Chlamydiota bacterium]
MAMGVGWQGQYQAFKEELISSSNSMAPILGVLPPEHEMESFTYKGGKFTLTLKKKQIRQVEVPSASLISEVVGGTTLIFKKVITGSFSPETVTLSLKGIDAKKGVRVALAKICGKEDQVTLIVTKLHIPISTSISLFHAVDIGVSWQN